MRAAWRRRRSPARAHRELEFVSKLELTGKFGDVARADRGRRVHKGFAYLNSWDEATCPRGGTYIVDIRDPAAPKEIGFVAAPPRSFHGEGAHVVTYKGRDILAVNNEPCTLRAAAARARRLRPHRRHRPDTPVKLGAPGAPTGGDTGPDDGSLVGTEVPHSNHSTVMWEFGRHALPGHRRQPRAPRRRHPSTSAIRLRPKPVAEHDLLEIFPQIDDQGNIGAFPGRSTTTPTSR